MSAGAVVYAAASAAVASTAAAAGPTISRASTKSSSSSSSLMKVLTTPSKVANALDWRKMNGSSILSLDIHADRIGLALASHPSSSVPTMVFPTTTTTTTTLSDGSSCCSTGTTSSTTCQPLEPIRFLIQDGKNNNKMMMKKKMTISLESKQRLSNLVRDHKVCGFVVSWPLQKDTGRMGASCGRTLYALEQLLSVGGDNTNNNEKVQPVVVSPIEGSVSSSSTPPLQSSTSSSSNTIFSSNRPICLWDSSHVQNKQPPVDSFGRCSAYGSCNSITTTTKTKMMTVHSAVREQYHQHDNVVAVQVWEDFCRTFWPDYYNTASIAETTTSSENHDDVMVNKNNNTKTSTMLTTMTTTKQKTMMKNSMSKTVGKKIIRKPIPATMMTTTTYQPSSALASSSSSSSSSWRPLSKPTTSVVAATLAA